jgi:hypothetical protein
MTAHVARGGTGVDAVAGREREHERAVPALERHEQARDAE